MERVELALAGLSPEERRYFDPTHPALGILPSSWFPAEVVHHALDQLSKGLSEAELDKLAEHGGEAMVKSMMRGAHGIVFSLFISPKRYGRLVKTLWRLNYDTGTATNQELGPTCHQGVVSGWKGHHPLLCRLNVAIKLALYRSIGCKHCTIEKRYCIARGDPDCGSIIRWDA